MSECPPKKTEAELEADVDYMLDAIAADIKSGAVAMSPDAVKQRVMEILKKRGMLKGGRRSRKSKKSSSKRRTRRSRKNKRSTRRRSKKN
jgi:hypothetical protein